MSRMQQSSSVIWDSVLDGHSPPARATEEPSRDAPLPARWHVKLLLLMVVLASVFCMAGRSLLMMDPLGILFWPVLAGFGTDRLGGGHGVWGGTMGGVLSFLAASWIAFTWPGMIGGYWGDPRSLALFLLSLGAGTCWGFYLSVWVYLLVETALQYV
jgi:hypothetical protein